MNTSSAKKYSEEMWRKIYCARMSGANNSFLISYDTSRNLNELFKCIVAVMEREYRIPR